jgi:mitosis inhibitor protein kinase SWE1
MRRRTSPRSPAKRALTLSTDSGNATPTQPISMMMGEDEENALTLDDLMGPNESNTCASPFLSTTPGAPPSDTPLAPRSSFSRIEKRRSGTFGSYATVSPLKRSDGIMNLDQASRGSPSAKRRSVHVPTTSDFSIFDTDQEHMPTSPSGSEVPPFPTPIQPFSPFATIPKRSSSLRRSTLQQRQGERSLFGRPRPAGEGEASPGTPLAVRPRTSLDSGLFNGGQDNLFSPLPAPASPLFSNLSGINPSAAGQPPRPAAHPLSRTITQSSSGSSLDDSPTHEPAPKPERSRPLINFSKSLPAGATRPAPVRRITREDSSGSDTFATPDNFKLVKPLPAAFMSTGLISKKNRNAEEPSYNKNMPDTPCKRPVNLFTAGPNPASERLFDQSRLMRQSDDLPPSPFNPPFTSTRPKPARGAGIFSNSFNRHEEPSRRGSYVSVDGDDMLQAQSPSSRQDSQPLNDSDFPPTPTKQTFLPSRTYPPATTQIASLERLSEARAGSHSTPLHDRFLQASPRTPRDQYFPPDPSGLSISVPNDQQSFQPDLGNSGLPATPTGPRESLLASKRPSLQLSGFHTPDVDPSLSSRFEKAELVGTGEFSQVYRVSQPHASSFPSVFSLPSSGPKSPTALPDQVWAVKKSKQPYLGLKDRERRIREVDILKTLIHSDHVISFVDSWEDCGHLYIQTEFCEEGSLDVFLAQAGLKARVDDFRIWKILLELSLGLKEIHDQGFIHLDLKPANILVTFEGVLKIADFGMAARWPAEDGIEGEGDREYIGPEILMGRFDKPADIFSLGLIMFEIAGNVELPDNGVSWQKLRNGDMSDVPSLTWSSETSIFRDASGNPVSESSSFEELCASDLGDDDFGDEFLTSRKLSSEKPTQLERSGELVNPPDFMVHAHHPQALDKIVRWMISPNPIDRPTADQILETYGVQFVNRRRRAGATIFEGNWGPADEILAEDAEMIDV